MLRFMITAAQSNSGKTAVTCGLLALLRRKGYDPCAFKCGPDYIDPMFHRSVLGIDSDNLDVFLAGEDGVRSAYERGCAGHDAAVIEGVMGYYDGMTASGTKASAWHVGSLLEVPAVLVLRPKGAALTLAAVIRGLASFRSSSRICGCILNDCSETFFRTYGPAIEEESGIPILGYVPHMQEADFESRHLGLMTADEIEELGQRIDRIGERMEETIDWPRLLAAAGAKAGESRAKSAGSLQRPEAAGGSGASRVRIAVARDKAFNFIYAASIRAMEEAGAEILWFSPLRDRKLPEGACGLYLPGGYPELYAKQLWENTPMRTSIREAALGGLPTIAECGGFLYLGRELADDKGSSWKMCDVLPGQADGKGRLVRFGYGRISCDRQSMLFRPGEQVPVHEFHYWDTSEQGSDLLLTKNSNGKQWAFGYATDTMYAGFPHLYLAGSPQGIAGGETLAQRFVTAARKYEGGSRSLLLDRSGDPAEGPEAKR
ncbi:MAG: cobyrinate a,c-diamide synthase [Firmicutes bacterium]|nr:cobyrinate a,c-diamide synthase [Bacillota bacterium]